MAGQGRHDPLASGSPPGSSNAMRRQTWRASPYFVLACLYTAQTLPGHFASNAIPVIMRMEKMPLDRIGLIGVIGLPWALKCLWAPVVDRYGGARNHYRKWALSMQGLFATVTLVLATLDLRTGFSLVMLLAALSYMFAATQDIAVDAYATRLLRPEQRGVGNGIQASANLLGVVLGSGAALALYIQTGWRTTLIALALSSVVLGLPLAAAGERPMVVERRASFRTLVALFRVPEVARWTPTLALACGGVFSALAMCRPLLVDRGYDWRLVAVISAVLPLASVPAAVGAGFAIRRWGAERILAGALLAGAIACGALGVAGQPGAHGVWLSAGLVLLHAGFGVLIAALNALSMNFARNGCEGSDFTALASVSFAGGMLPMAGAGFLAQRFGYSVTFICSAVLCLAVLGLFPRPRAVSAAEIPLEVGVQGACDQ